jgi:tRNA(Arg) A34 adenosine deaminase TadA
VKLQAERKALLRKERRSVTVWDLLTLASCNVFSTLLGCDVCQMNMMHARLERVWIAIQRRRFSL